MKRIKNILVRPDISIKAALKKMDKTGKRIIFISDPGYILRGVVTDGDIRRWILKGNGLDTAVVKIMKKKPIVLREGYLEEEAKELMLSKKIECIPVLGEKNRIISAIWWRDFFLTKLKQHKPVNVPVVIMAGGEGTRLLPFTTILPKPLIPIGEKPIIELIMDKFMEFGCKDFYLSVGYKADILKAYLSEQKDKYSITYIKEEKPMGTIGSLSSLRRELKNTFFVTNCDILIEADYADILKFHRANKNEITLVVSMKHYRIPYGICEIRNGGDLVGIQEKPEYDYLVNAGLYLLERSVLEHIPEKYFNMTDLIRYYISNNKKIGVYPVSDKSWLDMGEWQELQKMLKKFEVK